jgi:hypothetical protein
MLGVATQPRGKEKMTDEEAKVFAGMQTGLVMAIVHTFNTLHHRGVLSRDEAAASFRATEAALPHTVLPIARRTLIQIAQGIEAIDPDTDTTPHGALRRIPPTIQ